MHEKGARTMISMLGTYLPQLLVCEWTPLSSTKTPPITAWAHLPRYSVHVELLRSIREPGSVQIGRV
jgi:hypothetical protein